MICERIDQHGQTALAVGFGDVYSEEYFPVNMWILYHAGHNLWPQILNPFHSIYFLHVRIGQLGARLRFFFLNVEPIQNFEVLRYFSCVEPNRTTHQLRTAESHGKLNEKTNGKMNDAWGRSQKQFAP